MNITQPFTQFAARRPFVMVIIISALVVGISALGRVRKADVVDAEITFEQNASRPGLKANDKRKRLFVDVTQDPSYRTADRMRDASYIALLLALRRVEIFSNRQPSPPNVGVLLSGILPDLQANGFVPASDGSPGVLVGRGSTVYVRYRIAPFAVEVVSIPASNRYGDNIIVRLPADGPSTANAGNKAASIYTYHFTSELSLPAPFSSNELITAQGWKLEEARPSPLDTEEANRVVNSLGQVK